jgi:hypothetical protein
MTRLTSAPTDTSSRRRAVSVLAQLAWLMILLAAAGRLFVNESFMLASPVNLSALLNATALDLDPINHETLTRSLFTILLLGGAALWALSAAMEDAPTLRFPLWGLAIVGFMAFSAISCARSADTAQAWAVWWDQNAILLGGGVVAQLTTRERLRQWLTLMIALGLALAIKGVWQVAVEFPATRAMLAAHPDILSEVTASSDSTWATLYRARLAAATPNGFFSLSNVFASVILILLSGAVAVIFAIRPPSVRSEPSRTLQQQLMLALATITAIALAGVLYLTGSEAAVAAGVIVALAAGLMAWQRRRLAARRRLVMAGGLVLAIALAGGIVCGAPMAARFLPGGLGKSMAVRSDYWSTSQSLITQRPLMGWGGGQFGPAYLAAKPDWAEEDAQAPHNVAMHALTQFGLLGGGAYLLCLLLPLISLAGPRRELAEPPRPNGVETLALCALPIAMMLAMRTFFSESIGIEFIVFPAAWLGSIYLMRRAGALSTRWVPLVLGAGLAAMALHNLMTLSLWVPGAATLFWLAAGMALTDRESTFTLKLPAGPRWLIAVGLTSLLVMCILTALVPAGVSRARWATICQATAAGDVAHTYRLAERVINTGSPRDALCAAELEIALVQATTDPALGARLTNSAGRAARDAANALPNTTAQLRAGRVLWALGDLSDAITCFERAVEFDPTGLATRLMLAESYAFTNRPADVQAQIDVIHRIDAALPPHSAYRLTDSQRRRVTSLEAGMP